jgi:Cu-Zn family superoxide dismutase
VAVAGPRLPDRSGDALRTSVKNAATNAMQSDTVLPAQEETPMPTDRHRRCLTAATLAALLASASASGAGLRAVAAIKGCTDPKITGTATLTEQVTAEGIKEVLVEVRVHGLSDGLHAVHIHETGACEPCAAAKGHHDPGPFGQTRPDSALDTAPATDINHPYHMGDLINLEVKGGEGHMRHTTNRVTLSSGRLSIFDADGSAIIIHSQPDTYCDEESELAKGCAGGPRDACGVLEISRE